ncbi:hypothetical protein Cni_G22638 [Canna indica]|uniref:Protein KAKU4 n=1 Tax=Canna indica TaxID=4628 RepID=A0AAQ3QLC9_9LILI|nr:hypothetical protein Cni_G22638 [Canna indica]
MASLFRARRRAEEGGSGGKIIRNRRASQNPPASPYARPQPPALPPPPPPAGSPRWLLGIVSGAGKLISSVFRSSPSSSDYSSDEDSSHRFDEEENIGAPKQICGFNQEQKTAELITDSMEGSHAIVPLNESKLAIEKLLSQETFSRDECDRLTKLLQSRVVDSPEFVQDGVEKGVSNRDPGNQIDSSGSWLSLKRSTDLPGTVLDPPDDFSSRSPRTPALEACKPDVQNTAVMEAKKWIEEKKLSSNSKVDPVRGPCILNTDMLHYNAHDEEFSLVGLAKSYMQSDLPWQSPSFGSTTLTSPTPSRMDFCMDGSNDATTSHSLLPFKDFKRKYLSSRLRESLNDNYNARLKLAENMLESPAFKQIDPRDIFQNVTSKVSAPSDERDLLTVTNKSTSTTIASEHKETVKLVTPTKEIASSTVSSSDPMESKIASEPKLPIGLDAKRDVIDPLLTEQGNVVDYGIPHGSISASTSMVNAGEDPTSYSEKVVVTPGAAESTKLSNADVINLDNITQTSTANATTLMGIVEANNSMELDLNSDAKPLDENLHSQQGADGLANESSTNGGSVDLNVNPQSCYEEDQSSRHHINGDETTGATEQTYKHASEASVDAQAVCKTNSTTIKLENGAKMKSIERVLVEPKPNSSSRRKKAVVKVRRGRGRGAK